MTYLTHIWMENHKFFSPQLHPWLKWIWSNVSMNKEEMSQIKKATKIRTDHNLMHRIYQRNLSPRFLWKQSNQIFNWSQHQEIYQLTIRESQSYPPGACIVIKNSPSLLAKWYLLKIKAKSKRKALIKFMSTELI